MVIAQAGGTPMLRLDMARQPRGRVRVRVREATTVGQRLP